MRRQRRARSVPWAVTALVAGLVLASASAQLLGGNEVNAVQLAEAFESSRNENATQRLDDSVAPAVLESAMIAPSEGTDSRVLEQADASPTASLGTNAQTKIGLPYGGALVAVEATALLVGGATIVVLIGAKMKARAALEQYQEADEIDPMLQSLLYSDMDYAAI